jgi:hypothetical protein
VLISGSLLGLGAVLTDHGRAAEAEPLLRDALRLRLDQFGPGDRRTAKAQRALGVCLASLGRRREAERLLLDSHHTLASATNWYHRTLWQQTTRDLVALYERWGRPEQAAALREELGGRWRAIGRKGQRAKGRKGERAKGRKGERAKGRKGEAKLTAG